MNEEIRTLMKKHRVPESIMTIYGLEIERIAKDYHASQLEKKLPSEEEINKASNLYAQEHKMQASSEELQNISFDHYTGAKWIINQLKK